MLRVENSELRVAFDEVLDRVPFIPIDHPKRFIAVASSISRI